MLFWIPGYLKTPHGRWREPHSAVLRYQMLAKLACKVQMLASSYVGQIVACKVQMLASSDVGQIGLQSSDVGQIGLQSSDVTQFRCWLNWLAKFRCYPVQMLAKLACKVQMLASSNVVQIGLQSTYFVQKVSYSGLLWAQSILGNTVLDTGR